MDLELQQLGDFLIVGVCLSSLGHTVRVEIEARAFACSWYCSSQNRDRDGRDAVYMNVDPLREGESSL